MFRDLNGGSILIKSELNPTWSSHYNNDMTCFYNQGNSVHGCRHRWDWLQVNGNQETWPLELHAAVGSRLCTGPPWKDTGNKYTSL